MNTHTLLMTSLLAVAGAGTCLGEARVAVGEMAVKAQLDACGNEPDEEEFYQFRAQRRRGAKRREDLLRARQLDDTWRIRRDLAACLPSERRDSATDIWQSAQKALGEPLTWPENLGKGKPFEK